MTYFNASTIKLTKFCWDEICKCKEEEKEEEQKRMLLKELMLR